MIYNIVLKNLFDLNGMWSVAHSPNSAVDLWGRHRWQNGSTRYTFTSLENLYTPLYSLLYRCISIFISDKRQLPMPTTYYNIYNIHSKLVNINVEWMHSLGPVNLISYSNRMALEPFGPRYPIGSWQLAKGRAGDGAKRKREKKKQQSRRQRRL